MPSTIFGLPLHRLIVQAHRRLRAARRLRRGRRGSLCVVPPLGGPAAGGSDGVLLDLGLPDLDGADVPTLNRKEFDLLFAVGSRPGEVVTERQLLAEVWQMPWGGADRTVDVHLSWLRRKLGETAAEARYLISVRGVGVKLVDPHAA